MLCTEWTGKSQPLNQLQSQPTIHQYTWQASLADKTSARCKFSRQPWLLSGPKSGVGIGVTTNLPTRVTLCYLFLMGSGPFFLFFPGFPHHFLSWQLYLSDMHWHNMNNAQASYQWCTDRTLMTHGCHPEDIPTSECYSLYNGLC